MKNQVTIILVSGIPGSGKSMFIKNLKQKKLNQKIMRKIPEDARKWNVVDVADEKKDILNSQMLNKIKGEHNGIIVHFNYADAIKPIRDHKNDPKLSFIDNVQKLYVVVVTTEPEQLKKQFKSRLDSTFKSNRIQQAIINWKDARAVSALRRKNNKTIREKTKATWRYAIKPIMRAGKIVAGVGEKKRDKMYQDIKKDYMSLYDDKNLIQTALQNWIAFAEKKIKEHKHPEIIVVVGEEKNKMPDFKLIN